MDKKMKSSSGVKRSSSEKTPKKKESPSSIRRKPMITESDSDDDFIPPPTKKPHVTVKSEPPPTPVKNDVPTRPPVDVKMECDVAMPPKPPAVDREVKVKAGVKRKKSPVSDDGDDENGVKDEDNEWEGSGDSPDDDDDDFKPVAKKSKKSVSDDKKATTPKKTPSTKTPTSTKKSSASRKNSISKPETPTTKTKKDPTPKKTTPSSAKKATPAKKSSDSKKGSRTPGKDGGGTPVKGKKKEEEKEVWRWWDEKPHPEGVKWLTLEHKGPYFAPPYERLPSDVKFYYNGKPMKLSESAEEAATFFAKMLDHDYTTKDVFCNNFFADWRKEMTSEEAATIKDFTRCNFKEIHQHFVKKSEEKKQMTKEEKKKIKEANDAITEEYGWAIMDGHKEKIGNFKTEPPGLFRGRGDHPKQGKIKRRVQPEDVTINIGKKASAPPPPEGHKWKSVQHDNKVTWLASWTENIQSQIKYVMLNPTSRLKGEKDLAKYETARRLKGRIEEIRLNYESDLKSRETAVRQRAVALYFIDKLALRAGNEKDADEAADTVGCCSLRVEHIKLHEELNGKSDMVVFDFLGKDSIRYYNEVQVTHQVFKNLHLFKKGKETGDDLFDRLTTALLNKHLSELMEGLTAKVFRTYNASITLQEQLEELTKEDDTVNEKILSYNRANRAVAVLCNHQRTAPKTFDTQMSNLQAKITAKEEAILDTKKEIKKMKKELKGTSDSKLQKKLESKVKQLPKLEEQLKKLEIQATDKEENKEIALGTSKLNYLDPRISVSWCKKWDVPIEKVYNRTQREKFAWAIEMADETFVF